MPGVDQNRRETARSQLGGQVPLRDCWRAQEVWRVTNMEKRHWYWLTPIIIESWRPKKIKTQTKEFIQDSEIKTAWILWHFYQVYPVSSVFAKLQVKVILSLCILLKSNCHDSLLEILEKRRLKILHIPDTHRSKRQTLSDDGDGEFYANSAIKLIIVHCSEPGL